MAERVTEAGCIFCAIVAGEAPARIIHEDDRTLAFLDVNPLTTGHSLVIPKNHSVDLHRIPADDLAAVSRSSKLVAGMLTERLGSDGVNLLNACGGAAWQTVFHFHMHVLPRVAGDIAFPFPQREADEVQLQATFDRIIGSR